MRYEEQIQGPSTTFLKDFQTLCVFEDFPRQETSKKFDDFKELVDILYNTHIADGLLVSFLVNTRWTTAEKPTSRATVPPWRSMLSKIPSQQLHSLLLAAKSTDCCITSSRLLAPSSECLDSTSNCPCHNVWKYTYLLMKHYWWKIYIFMFIYTVFLQEKRRI